MMCVATFNTTSMAIMFERACRKEGIKAKIIPVPRSLSASCGLACDFPCDERERIDEICRSGNIETEALYNISDDGKHNLVS